MNQNTNDQSENLGPEIQVEEFVNKKRRQRKTQEEKRAAKLSKIERIKERTESICVLCDQPLDDPADETVDHIIPKGRGGSNRIDNLRITHGRCNNRKGDHLDEELELPFTWEDS